MERQLSFTGSTQVTHIIEMEKAHLERLQQQKPAQKSTLWKRLFYRKTGTSNRTVNTACLSQSSSSRSVHNSPSYAEEYASSADGDNSHVQYDDIDDSAIELIHSSPLDVSSHYGCCISPCGSLEEVFNMVQIPSFSNTGCDDDTGIEPTKLVEDGSSQESVKEMHREAQELMAMGEHERALHMFRDVMKFQEQKHPVCPFEMANVCYACTRCAYSLRDYDTAFHYALRELYYTKQCGNGVPTLAVATSYHELARICKGGLGDLAQALRYYRAALSTSQSCLERWRPKLGQCKQCQQLNGRNGASLCPSHRADQAEILGQIQESKQSIGRIYFEMGNFDAAMRMI